MRIFFLLSAILGFCPWLWAQDAAPLTFKNSGTKFSYRTNGVRIDGTALRPARVQLLPQLDVSALAISVDFQPGGSVISQVRALGGVAFKINFPSRAGSANARIEATCQNATLVRATRTLVLKGNIRGFYQLGDGPQNPISGETATFVVDEQNNVNAQIEGGSGFVSLSVPSQGFGGGAAGTVVVTARNVGVNEKTGEAVFTGNARAKTVGAAQNFEVVASAFTVSRGASGQLSELVTSGKTSVKLDLPPDAVAPNSAFGRPTRVEVTANSARVSFATATGVFEGQVSGFYRLQPATGAAQNYKFSGGKAVITFKDTLGVDVTGEPVSIEAPGFEF